MKFKSIMVSFLLMAEGLFASNEPSKFPFGEAIMGYARHVYMSMNPEAKGKLKIVSPISDPRITSEIETLVHSISNLCYDDNGQILALEINQKNNEMFVKFSNNSDYKTALAIIRPFNTPEGLQAVLEAVNKGKSLKFVDCFNKYKKVYGNNASQKIAEKQELCCACGHRDSYLHVPIKKSLNSYAEFQLKKRK